MNNYKLNKLIKRQIYTTKKIMNNYQQNKFINNQKY